MASQCFAFLTRIHDLMMRNYAHYRLAGLFVLATFVFQGGAWSFSGSGSGVFEDPFVITDVDQLQEMSDDLGAYYILGNDIDASDTVNWNDGAGFEPIGDATEALISDLDGQGHTIASLFINRPLTDFVGLFGKFSTATITNVTMEGVNITGKNFVGSLVGSSNGEVKNCRVSGAVSGQSHVGGLSGYNIDTLIENCYATVSVSGSTKVGGMVGGNYEEGEVSKSYAAGDVSGSSEIGGLVGVNGLHSCVSNSYATGTVSGSIIVGGLVGRNENRVENCYATGAVSGNASVGGLVGEDTLGIYSSCYWDTVTSETTIGVGNLAQEWPDVAGKTTAEMHMQATFSGWSFDLSWLIDEGNDYPKLGFFSVSYLITTLEQLQQMNFDLEGEYVLGADIDASDTATWNNGAGFVPISPNGIGAGGIRFTGVFEGQGHTITNLFINRPSMDFVGLFGTSEATIRNVSVELASVTGQVYVGGLTGFNSSRDLVSNCSVTGTVSGTDKIGGLIGKAFGDVENCFATAVVSGTGTEVGGLIGELRGTVSKSYATGAVSGLSAVGGLVGKNDLDGQISNSYAMGPASASGMVGGLVGEVNSGTVTHCYSTGAVSGMGNEVGGLVGRNATGTYTACYWDTDTTPTPGIVGINPDPSGVTGKTTVEMQQQATYSAWSFLNVWTVDEGNDYPKFGFFPVSYTITTLQELQNMNHDLEGDYILANDIDASDTVNWNDGAGFLPIAPDMDALFGHQGEIFTGSLDGQGHTITGLFINRPSTDYVGLFSQTSGATLHDVTMEVGSVTGQTYVGGLVGYTGPSDLVSNCYATGAVSGFFFAGGLIGINFGSVKDCCATGTVSGSVKTGGLLGMNLDMVENCYATGLVSGTGSEVGGLVGDNRGTVSKCYAMGVVSGSDTVGGLVGLSGSGGQLSNCYAMGAVSASATVGGLIGEVNSSAVTHCYSTGVISGTGSEVGGFVGRDDNGTGIFTGCYWDTDTAGLDGFFGSKIVLVGITGRTTIEMQQQAIFSGWDFSKTWIIDEGNDYPRLGIFSVAYTITTLQQLQNMNYDLEGDYVLANDIDASDTRNWNGIMGFDPIGDDDNFFTGSFDGRGHRITDLSINRTSTDSVGLFGHCSGNSLMNVGLEGGSISGRSAVGFLVGFFSSGAVSKCYADGVISGSENVGGLAGLTDRSFVSNCYTTGLSNGASAVGGLVGWNIATEVTHCYSNSLIVGLPTQGGLIGDNSGGSYTLCYWDIDTAFVAGGVGNATPDPSGVTGKTTVEMFQQATFTGWDFDTIWSIVENQSYPFFQGSVLPTVVINQSLTQADPTSALPIIFDVTFSEWVIDSRSIDVDFSEGALVSAYTVTGNEDNYTVTVTEASEGIVKATIPESVAFASNIPNTTSTSDDNEVTFGLSTPTPTPTGEPSPTCIADGDDTVFNLDGINGIDARDLLLLYTALKDGTGNPYDLDCSGETDILDLFQFSQRWQIDLP